MPIRELTDFFHPMLSGCKIYANRGLSGIDGNIATSIGIAKALNQPVIAIIGDQTFLHDSSSLSQLKIFLKSSCLRYSSFMWLYVSIAYYQNNHFSFDG
jgi:2-succinyl-5-enolpyruvyl-6-hydroxy-3-cyclohexene-1-carboxylate synthase